MTPAPRAIQMLIFFVDIEGLEYLLTPTCTVAPNSADTQPSN